MSVPNDVCVKLVRPSHDEYFITMAALVSMRGTCVRRRVGCVLVDEKNHVMATGYGGVPRGMIHCIDSPCPGAYLKSGEGLEICEATHAEQNALLQCKDTERIYTCYTTTSPCVTCLKLLMNTSCRRIVFHTSYVNDVKAHSLWTSSPFREWIRCPISTSLLEGIVIYHAK